MLWILFLTVFGLFYEDSSTYTTLCPEMDLDLTPVISPPFYKKSLYFSPIFKVSRETVINNGKIFDSRIKVYGQKVYLKSVTEEDEGTFSSINNELIVFINDCDEKILKYIDMFERNVPNGALFLMFKPLGSQDKKIVRWHRTQDNWDNYKKRGDVMGNVWRISKLTQADSGSYYFFQENDIIVDKFILTVKEGSSIYFEATLCPEMDLDLTPVISPPFTKKSLYFESTLLPSTKTLIDNGMVRDPRIKVYGQKVYLKSVTKKDDGIFSSSAKKDLSVDIVDCVQKKYMDEYQHQVPDEAQILKFKPLGIQDKSVIIWRRTEFGSLYRRRGNVRGNVWTISNLTQADSGSYSFTQKNDIEVDTFVLSVKEHSSVTERSLTSVVGYVKGSLQIKYPSSDGLWSVSYINKKGTNFGTLIRENKLVSSNSFSRRIHILQNGFKIDDLKIDDSGTFEFRDSKGNLAKILKVEVIPNPSTLGKYIGIAVGAVLSAICSICGFCCKKKCKTDNSEPQTEEAPATHDTTSGAAAATAVTYHFQNVNPPTGPSYPAPAHPPVFPHQPPYQPASVYPPPQPGTSMNPF